LLFACFAALTFHFVVVFFLVKSCFGMVFITVFVSLNFNRLLHRFFILVDSP
jgi:uncharacterized membrane protein